MLGQNMLDPPKKNQDLKKIGSKEFFGPIRFVVKIFLVKKILVKKIFGPEYVCPKIVTQKNLSSQKLWMVQKDSRSKTIFGSKNVWFRNLFGPNKFWVQKIQD